MKLATSVRNALLVAARLRAVNGIIATPCCTDHAIRVKRMWLFGSTVKGKANPNDTDLLFEFERVSDSRRYQRQGKLLRWFKFDRGFFNRYRVRAPRDSWREAVAYLRGGQTMIRFHSYEIDGEIATPRVLLYPRNDFN